jgi:hypothetical protein
MTTVFALATRCRVAVGSKPEIEEIWKSPKDDGPVYRRGVSVPIGTISY